MVPSDTYIVSAGRYPTSAVFYSEREIVTLIDEKNVAEYVPKAYSWSEKNVMEDLNKAAELSKADLVTGVVTEFTELQGVMGREYALLDGEKQEVAQAIYEHYLPRFAGDELPKGELGRLIGIADKIDNIVATFSRGKAPTGSQDPYALRRQALGVVNIALEAKYNFSLKKIMADGLQLLNVSIEDIKLLVPQLLEFFKQRVKNMMLDNGIRYDVIDAVLADNNNDDLLDLFTRAKALSDYVQTPAAIDSIQAFTRVDNICKQTVSEIAINQSLFQDSSEKELHVFSKQTAKGG